MIILCFLVFRREHRGKTNVNISLQEYGKNLKISLVEIIEFITSLEISKRESCDKFKTIDNKFQELQNLLKIILDRYIPKQVVKIFKKTITVGLITN